jgi:hypothetical protein
MERFFRKYFVGILYLVIVILLIGNLFVVHAETILGRHYSFAWRFYFDRRLNFPFFFSLSLLLINLFLLYRIIRIKTRSKPQAIFWITMGIAFLLFTVDEAFYIHQHFKMKTFGTIASYDRASWSHYLWVIPYFVIFGILMTLLFRYSSAITNKLKRDLLIAGLVFLLGAVGMEFAGTYYAIIRPRADVYLLLIKSAEGLLQMIGSVMFIQIFYRHHNDLEINT